MTYVRCVDIGISRPAAAIVRVVDREPVIPEPLPLGRILVPLVIFVTEDGYASAGEAAVAAGVLALTASAESNFPFPEA